MLFWYLSFQPKTVATGPQRSTTSRRVPNAAPGSGVVQRSAARRDGSRCGDLAFFFGETGTVPGLVMTNIAIENGDLVRGFTHL